MMARISFAALNTCLYAHPKQPTAGHCRPQPQHPEEGPGSHRDGGLSRRCRCPPPAVRLLQQGQRDGRPVPGAEHHGGACGEKKLSSELTARGAETCGKPCAGRTRRSALTAAGTGVCGTGGTDRGLPRPREQEEGLLLLRVHTRSSAWRGLTALCAGRQQPRVPGLPSKQGLSHLTSSARAVSGRSPVSRGPAE